MIDLRLHRLRHPMDITPAPTVVPSLIGLRLHHPQCCYIELAFNFVISIVLSPPLPHLIRHRSDRGSIVNWSPSASSAASDGYNASSDRSSIIDWSQTASSLLLLYRCLFVIQSLFNRCLLPRSPCSCMSDKAVHAPLGYNAVCGCLLRINIV